MTTKVFQIKSASRTERDGSTESISFSSGVDV